MGLLDCNDPSMNMLCDVYYAVEEQDKYGAMHKKWVFDQSLSCSFFTLDPLRNRNIFSFEDNNFMMTNTLLMGRSKKDLRKSASGEYFPLSHILVTNVRSSDSTEELLYVSTNGNWEAVPTVFEILNTNPFNGPFGIEYYKAQLKRADNQGVLE